MAWSNITVANATAGNAILASDHEKAFQNLNEAPRGIPATGARAQITTSSASFTTVADISGLSITYSQVSGRTYLTVVHLEVASTVNGDTIVVALTDGSNTTLSREPVYLALSTLSQSVAIVFYEVAASSASVTRKVRCNRNSGTGTCTVNAGATFPAQIISMDVGAPT
jgi:hypothetical protein